MSRSTLPPKPPTSTELVEFDFTSQIPVGETIESAVCTMAVWTGTDTSPSDMIEDAAVIDGLVVGQLITGGVDVSKPTTSSMPASFGSAIENPFDVIPTTTSLAEIPRASR